jgi:hypothetical protein
VATVLIVDDDRLVASTWKTGSSARMISAAGVDYTADKARELARVAET